MFVQGMAGMSRRMYDGGATYAEVPAGRLGGIPGLSHIVWPERPISQAAVCLGWRKFRSSSISSGASTTAGK